MNGHDPTKHEILPELPFNPLPLPSAREIELRKDFGQFEETRLYRGVPCVSSKLPGEVVYIVGRENYDHLRVHVLGSDSELVVAEGSLVMFSVNANVSPKPYVPNLSAPRIVCAANYYVFRSPMGTPFGIIVPGPRHYDGIMAPLVGLLRSKFGEELWSKQGFVDQHCRWYDRTAARQLAEANEQIRKEGGWPKKDLYSENLY